MNAKKLGFIIAFSIGILSITAGQFFLKSLVLYSDMNLLNFLDPSPKRGIFDNLLLQGILIMVEGQPLKVE